MSSVKHKKMAGMRYPFHGGLQSSFLEVVRKGIYMIRVKNKYVVDCSMCKGI